MIWIFSIPFLIYIYIYIHMFQWNLFVCPYSLCTCMGDSLLQNGDLCHFKVHEAYAVHFEVRISCAFFRDAVETVHFSSLGPHFRSSSEIPACEKDASENVKCLTARSVDRVDILGSFRFMCAQPPDRLALALRQDGQLQAMHLKACDYS